MAKVALIIQRPLFQSHSLVGLAVSQLHCADAPQRMCGSGFAATVAQSSPCGGCSTTWSASTSPSAAANWDRWRDKKAPCINPYRLRDGAPATEQTQRDMHAAMVEVAPIVAWARTWRFEIMSWRHWLVGSRWTTGR